MHTMVRNPLHLLQYIPDNLVYVTEEGNNQISIFDTSGTFLHCIDKIESRDQNLNSPCGTAVDKLNNICVSNFGNNRLVIYNITRVFPELFFHSNLIILCSIITIHT